jgi:hypothetical protein
MQNICAVVLCFCLSASAAEIHVKPGEPLEKARDAARSQGQSTIWLAGGTYRITQTLELDQRDSNIIWRAMPGETVRFSGAAIIDPKEFTQSKIEHVLQVDLKHLGITDFGKMEPRGFGQPDRVAPMELFFNDRPMQLARWPNEGYAKYGAIIDPGSAPRLRDPLLDPSEQKIEPDRPGTFVYEGDRPSRWTNAKDAWLFGYWKYDWADETIKIAKIDSAKHQITLAAPHFYGLEANKRFYALNILEELDAPGEYFIDRDAGVLYFWPPADLAGERITVSTFAKPIVAIENVHHVTFRDITFEDTRAYAIYMAGGHDNTIDHCTIRNTGQLGALIGEGAKGRDLSDNNWAAAGKLYTDTAWNRNAGTNNGIRGCTIYNTGGEGIILSGGDRKTLTSAANFADENDIHHVGRWTVQNHPAINIDGVGNRASKNFIHDCPHCAIMYNGNDHVIEFNEIARCVTDSSDAGAIYNGRDPSARGNVIRYNFMHDIGPPANRGFGAHAVYFDDGISGQTVLGNVFVKAGTDCVIFMNGGYDNVIENNVFLACPEAVRYSNWGNPEWNRYAHSKIIQQRVTQSVDIRKPPYLTKYPKLASVLDDRLDVKRENVQKKNFIATTAPSVADALREAVKQVAGFEPIPFEQIGITARK